MFIIDFDDTLFDTQTFKEIRSAAVRELGISDELYWQTYDEARFDAHGFSTYSNERHAETLARHGYDKARVLSAFEHPRGVSLPDFLFPDAVPFLQRLKQRQQPLILLSHGDPLWQEEKVKGAGIDHYFNRIFFVQDTKAHVVGELLEHHHSEARVWFVNDKVIESQEIHRLYPSIRVILKVCRRFPLTDYETSGLPYSQTLTEIYNYVERNLS